MYGGRVHYALMGRTRLLLKQLKLEMLKKTLSVVYLLQIKAKILFITKIQEYSKTCVKQPLSNRQGSILQYF